MRVNEEGCGVAMAIAPEKQKIILNPFTEQLLIRLGSNPAHLGHVELCLAIDMVRDDSIKRLNLYKCTYVEVAHTIRIVSPEAVDLGIRRELDAIWKKSQDVIIRQLFCGQQLLQKPSPARFISAAAVYLAAREDECASASTASI